VAESPQPLCLQTQAGARVNPLHVCYRSLWLLQSGVEK